MTPNEAAGVLAVFTAAFPNTELEDPTIELWLSALAEVDHADAMAATRTVIRNERFFPAVSTFFDAVATESHARRNREATMRGLPGPSRTVDEDRFRDAIESVWDQLAARGTRQHWHGGTDPCPVCGQLGHCPTCGTTHDAPVRRGREAKVIDLEKRLKERRARLDREAQ